MPALHLRRSQSVPPASPAKRQPQASHRDSQSDALEALQEFVVAHEESGFFCAGLNAAYMHAKRVLARRVGKRVA